MDGVLIGELPLTLAIDGVLLLLLLLLLSGSVYASNVKISCRSRLCETARWWERREKFFSPHIGQIFPRR